MLVILRVVVFSGGSGCDGGGRVVSEAQFQIRAAPTRAKNRSNIGVFLLKGLILSQKSGFTLKSFLFLVDFTSEPGLFHRCSHFSDFSMLTFL